MATTIEMDVSAKSGAHTDSRPPAVSRIVTAMYGLAVLVSAFLLFQIQPLMGNVLLPRFGGSASVWGVCLVFFQTVLLAGYLYAHLLTRAARLSYQVAVHLLLLVVAVAVLKVLPGEVDAQDVAQPTTRILMLLMTTVGLPYLLLSATSPLLQAWFVRTGSSEPYGLYALSNLGSMLGLLSYVFLIQPAIEVHRQAQVWSAGFLILAVLCTVAAVGTLRGSRRTSSGPKLTTADGEPSAAATIRQFGIWLALSAGPSIMLLATTNVLCLEVAPAPLLWVVPLSIYLLTMMITFARPAWYHRRACSLVAIVLLMATAWAANQKAGTLSVPSHAVLFNGCLFAVCMLGHGELVRQRPVAERLTSFYLASALGGALGGILVVIVAPLVFSSFVEYQAASIVSLLLGGGLLAIPVQKESAREQKRRKKEAARSPQPTHRSWLLRSVVIASIPLAVYVGILLGTTESDAKSRLVARGRDFYGVVSVYDFNFDRPNVRGTVMLHNRVRHGAQSVRADARRSPLTYYHPQSGVGLAMAGARARRGMLRVGVVGLGAGTLAAYGQAGDHFRFYEISPVVIELANKHFTYLSDSPAAVECVLGDGRISLQHEPPQQFDVLVIDAFSGDAIPLHLLTKEAMDIYVRQLKPEGVLAFHVTNNQVDLSGPVHALARCAQLEDVQIVSPGDPARGYLMSRWHLLTRDAGLVKQFARFGANPGPDADWQAPWTDGMCSLISVLR